MSAVNIHVSFSLLLTYMKLCTIVFLGKLREQWQKIFCSKMFREGKIGQNNSLLYLLFFYCFPKILGGQTSFRAGRPLPHSRGKERLNRKIRAVLRLCECILSKLLCNLRLPNFMEKLKNISLFQFSSFKLKNVATHSNMQ